MKDSRAFGRKWLWANFKVMSQNSPVVTEEYHEKPVSIADLRVEI
jgi:hypothetical protein